MYKGGLSNEYALILIAFVIMSLFVVVMFLGPSFQFLYSKCWKDSISNIDNLRDSIRLGESNFELFLNPQCTLRVELVSNKNRCGLLCQSDEYTGDVEDCLKKCTACSRVEDATGFVIGVPRIADFDWETAKKVASERGVGSVELLREIIFNDIYCRATREYEFANDLIIEPTENERVFCLEISRIAYQVDVQVKGKEPVVGACGYG